MEDCGEGVQVKLLGGRSPFVVRVRIALALKGIDYEFIEENLQNKSELLLQSNPVYKKIPVLIDHNGKPVCESMVIVQYIDEVWNTKTPNLMPKDSYDRAIARFWAAFVDDKIFPCVRGVFMGQGEQLQKAAEESVTNLLLIEEAMKTCSCFSGKPYFGGDEIGFVDIALGSVSPFIIAVEKVTNTVLVDPKKMPLLSAWMDRFHEFDGLKDVMPDPGKLLEFVSTTRARITSPSVGDD
uniref:glutathione transferase n=1 Tax=Larix kaempferi TaxID=54800 RepID=V5L6K2_9CONI|nr:tau class glutathione S-transferase [Larix kaempferi]